MCIFIALRQLHLCTTVSNGSGVSAAQKYTNSIGGGSLVVSDFFLIWFLIFPFFISFSFLFKISDWVYLEDSSFCLFLILLDSFLYWFVFTFLNVITLLLRFNVKYGGVMNMDNKICVHCGCEFEPNPRLKEQKYCGRKECQLARRRIYQSVKMRTDPIYKDNQRNCQKDWHERHPGYYRKYRKKNPQYTEKNRAQQRLRDMRRRKNGLVNLLAKMDSLSDPLHRRSGGLFKLIPKDRELLAKMDSFTVELIPV